jgi:hypothetical protein|tara:strand:+ start:240 stop:527 length:288 start_codon:yes stop_codon:yes gene_type:complete
MADSQDYKGTADIAVMQANFVSAHTQMLEGKERIAELEDLLGRYANGVADAEGDFYEPEGAEGEYIVELAKRARAKETPLPMPVRGQFSVPQSRS